MSSSGATLPRLLEGCVHGEAMRIDRHATIHGELPRFERRRDGAEHPLIRELDKAGLRGHGGAAYPTAAKFRAVAQTSGSPVVVANGCEGEPTSHKDHLLLAQLPHLVLDGAVLAARALGAQEIIVAVEREAAIASRAVESAMTERADIGRRGLSARVAGIPAGYVSGQDTAVIHKLNGGSALPTVTPPYPATRGFRGRPTLVLNAETLAHVALIGRHGAAWYRRLGTRDQPGSRLITLLGAVARPGVLEVASGTSLHAVVKAAGGVTERLGAFLLGGYAGTWVGSDSTAVNLEEAGLRKRGATLGAGILFALPEAACPVAEVARVTRWLASNNAGQCGPCIHGLDAIAGALEELTADGDRSGAYANVKRWCRLVSGRGACAMPDGAGRFVRSALRVFGHDFDDHARHGGCDDCLREPQLPIPDRAELFVR